MREPLATLLSQVLVAFTVEFDNEAEHRMPHRTTRHGRSAPGLPAPWLVSLAMWENCMHHLPLEGISVAELELRAHTTANLAGMQRWRYVTVAPDPADKRPKPPRSDWIVKPTVGGRMAQEIWRPLPAEIESRWHTRFGAETIAKLRDALIKIDQQLDPRLPDCMPILKYGLFCAPPKPSKKRSAGAPASSPERPLHALLARPLLAFALEFEAGFKISLAICADLLRVIAHEIVRVRDLPALSGVSKEALSMGMGILRKRELAIVEKSTEGEPWLRIYLTPQGRALRNAYLQRLEELERAWRPRYGERLVDQLFSALQQIGAGAPLSESSLMAALEPHPEGWRAALPPPSVLPHFPMVLHRGGYPDGS